MTRRVLYAPDLLATSNERSETSIPSIDEKPAPMSALPLKPVPHPASSIDDCKESAELNIDAIFDGAS